MSFRKKLFSVGVAGTFMKPPRCDECEPRSSRPKPSGYSVFVNDGSRPAPWSRDNSENFETPRSSRSSRNSSISSTASNDIDHLIALGFTERGKKKFSCQKWLKI